MATVGFKGLISDHEGVFTILQRELTGAVVGFAVVETLVEYRDCCAVLERPTATRPRRTATASPDHRPLCSSCCAGTSENRSRNHSLAPAQYATSSQLSLANVTKTKK